MPEEENGRRFNTGVVWSQRDRVRFVHRKHFLPEMAGFFERTWFSRGLAQFESEELAGAKVGFAICTELWAMDIARHYGRRGVHFLVTPRATGSESIDKWIAAGRTAAVIAGAFEAWPQHRRSPKPWPVRIRFGPPVDLSNLDSAQIVATVDRTLRTMFDEMRGEL